MSSETGSANVVSDAVSKLPPVESSSSTATTSTKSPTTVIRVAVGSTNPCKLQAVQLAFERVLAPRTSCAPNDSTPTIDDDNNNHKKLPSTNIRLDIQGFHVPSHVSDQPKGDDETKLGAQNRARGAYQAYKEQFQKVPHFAVGLEGGIEMATKATIALPMGDGGAFTDTTSSEQNNTDVWCMAWMAVYGKRQALLADLVASSSCHHYYGDKRPIFGLAKTSSFLLPQEVAKLIVVDGWELGDADDQVFGRKQNKHGAGTVGILTDFLIPRAAYYEHALILALIPWIRPDLYPHGCSGS